MAKQLGRAMLLKMDVASTATLIATLNTKEMTINNQPIDVTTPDASDPDGPLWQESLAGLKSISLSFDGRFADTTVEAALAAVANADEPVAEFEVTIPELGTYTGNFRLETFAFGGEQEGPLTFSGSLMSTGAIVFAVASG